MGSSKILRVAKNEYVKWIHNPKLIIVLVMIIFAYDFVIKELTEAADKMGEKLQIFEGFIGISNSQLLLMIIPIVFVGLMGDFPRVDGNAMFYIHRVGKTNWLLGQMLFAAMASATYLTALLSFSTLSFVGRWFFDNKWSEVTTKYYIFAPDDYGSVVANLTTGRLYNNMPPLDATLNILVVMFLFLFLISMMLLASFVCKVRVVGIVVTTGILCVGNILAYMGKGISWIFPTGHAIMELHFDPIYKEPVMALQWSYIYYIVLIFILFVVAFIMIDKYDFSKIQELEE